MFSDYFDTRMLSLMYCIDKVFGQEALILELYEFHVKNIIASNVKGFNVLFSLIQISAASTPRVRKYASNNAS